MTTAQQGPDFFGAAGPEKNFVSQLSTGSHGRLLRLLILIMNDQDGSEFQNLPKEKTWKLEKA